MTCRGARDYHAVVRFAILLLFVVVAGCSDGEDISDAGERRDASEARDASASDDASTPRDAGDTDSGAPSDAGSATPCFWEERWDYADTAAMIAANTNTFSLGTVSLETGTLPDGSTGNFMRATLRGDGTEDDTNFDLDIPGAAAGVTDEIWVEFYLRFDDAWSGTSDDKTFFVFPPEGMGSRWEIHYGLGTRVYGGPSGAPGDFFVVSEDGSPLDLEDVWDGQWHRHRLYLRISSASGVADGAFYWWFDDAALVSDTVADLLRGEDGEAIDTTPTADSYFSSVRLGANADPVGSGVRDWGPVCVHTTDPGW